MGLRRWLRCRRRCRCLGRHGRNAVKYYGLAVAMGRAAAEAGVCGHHRGGPGTREAANRGAREAGGVSVGLNISLPMEQKANPFQNVSLTHHYFFVRKVMFIKYSHAFICFPAGSARWMSCLSRWRLIQTMKIDPFPVILFGSEFWNGLAGWLHESMCERFHTISEKDFKLFEVMDDIDQVADRLMGCEADQCWRKPPEPGPVAPEQKITAEGTRYGVRPKIVVSDAFDNDTYDGGSGVDDVPTGQ